MQRTVKPSIPPKVLEAFEHFYRGMEGESGQKAERRLRDMLIQYWKTEEGRDDGDMEQFTSDMYFYFMILDACADRNKTEKGR